MTQYSTSRPVNRHAYQKAVSLLCMTNTDALSESSRKWIYLLSLWGVIVTYLLAFDIMFSVNELLQTSVAVHLASALSGSILITLLADTSLSQELVSLADSTILTAAVRAIAVLTVVGVVLVNQDISALISIYAVGVYTVMTAVSGAELDLG